MAAYQLLALYVVNAALVGVLRNQGGFDIEAVRTKVLEAFTGAAENANAVAHINALLGSVETGAVPLSEDEERDRLREVARSRFRVIDGGRPGEE